MRSHGGRSACIRHHRFPTHRVLRPPTSPARARSRRSQRERGRSGTTRAPSSSVPTSGSARVCRHSRYLGKTVAIETLGSISHCQLEQIARVKKVGMNRVTVKPMRTLDAIVHTIATEEIDAGIVPASYARDLLASNQAKLVGWYSELDEIQFGVLFASSKMIAIRQSRNSYVRTDAGSPTTRRRCCARTGIPSVPQTPSRTKRRQPLPGMFILIVEPAPRLQSRRAPIIDPQAQLDVADIDRQIAWHKAQGRSTRPSAHAMSLIEFRQVGIFPQRRISLASLPMS